MTKELFDCWFVEGEIDPEKHGSYLKNDKFKETKVKHNVSKQEAQEWHSSSEVAQMAHQSYMKNLTPSYFWTIAEG